VSESSDSRYHGFVSYSHRGDLALAPALQKALQQMARPWSKRRALQVFRDQTGLSVNPALWTSITKALDDSEWFVLLASPESAESEWVGREITHWVQNRGVERLLPVVTGGEWVWDPTTQDLDWSKSTAAHPALRGVFHEPPRYVDLSWARRDTDLSLRNARFRDAIAEIAAPMHGVSKPELETEHIRQQRRARRLVRSAVSGLVVLATAAIGSGALAVVNARSAAQQRDRALTQLRLTTASNLINRSSSVVGSDQAVSILLALESYRLEPSASAEGKIRTLLDTDVTGLLHGPVDGVVDLAFDADHSHVVAVDGAGSVHVWQLDGRKQSLSTEPARYASADWLSDSELVVGDLDGTIFVVDTDTGDGRRLAENATVVTDLNTGLIRPVVATNPISGLVAIGKRDGSIAVFGEAGQQEYTIAADPVAAGSVIVGLVVTSDGRLIAHYGGPQIAVWQLDGGQTTRLTADRTFFQDVSIENGRVLGAFAGGLAIDASESRIAVGDLQLDARTGEELTHEGCGPIIRSVASLATTYVGGTTEPVVGTAGGVGLIRNPVEVPAQSAGQQGSRELCVDDGERATALPITGSVVSMAGSDDGLILAGGSAGPVVMVRYGAAAQRGGLEINELLGVACFVAGRNLSPTEWTALIPSIRPEQICAQWPDTKAAAASPANTGTTGG
jgi:TIR domain